MMKGLSEIFFYRIGFVPFFCADRLVMKQPFSPISPTIIFRSFKCKIGAISCIRYFAYAHCVKAPKRADTLKF